MCGRYVLKTLPGVCDDLFDPFALGNDLPQVPRINVAPTQTAPIVAWMPAAGRKPYGSLIGGRQLAEG